MPSTRTVLLVLLGIVLARYVLPMVPALDARLP